MTGLSLRTKILLSLAGLILLFGFGAAFYGRQALSTILGDELREKGAKMGKNLALQTEPYLLTDDTFSLYELFNSTLSSDPDVRYIFIELPSGALSYHTFDKGMPAGLKEANKPDSDANQSLLILSSSEGRMLDIATPVFEGKEGTLRLGLSFARHEALVKQYIYYLFLLLGTAAIIALLISHFLARLLTRPIASMNKVTNAVAQGDLSLKVPQGKDEIGRLGTNFNIMTGKLSLYRDELLQRNRELTTLNEQRSQLLKQVIKAQEEERKRVARELHDDIGPVLSQIAVVLRDIEEQGNEPANLADRVSRAKKESDHALQSLRETILNLRPAVIDDLGLIPALRWYARERLEKPGVKFSLEVKGIRDRFNPQIEIVLFRVIQEAINNIAKYAGAKEASVSLELKNGNLIGEIRDNGTGFNVGEFLSSNKMTGLGLLGMKERLALVNGTFKVSSKIKEGTTVRLEIPI